MTLKQYINRMNKPLGEVELFDEMIGYFKSQPFAVVVGTDRTHQHKVTYTPLSPYDTLWGQSIEKEISDVFFMVFSPSKRIARMTHLQAKLKEQNWPKNSKTKKFTFKLDAGQFHMLHNRLRITDTSHRFADDILSNPCFSDSVASYGVFYRNLQHGYDMAYEIASLIWYPRHKQYEKPNSQLVHNFYTIKDLWDYRNSICRNAFCGKNRITCFPELLSTTSVDVFESELINLHVGTRVEFNERILREIAKIFKSDTKITPQFNKLINTLFPNDNRDNDNTPREDRANAEELGRTCILINADMANFDYIRNKRD